MNSYLEAILHRCVLTKSKATVLDILSDTSWRLPQSLTNIYTFLRWLKLFVGLLFLLGKSLII